MKKILILSLALFSIAAVASAQMASIPPAITVSPTPIEPSQPITPVNSGFVQFDNLVVQSVSSESVPAEIVATISAPIPAMDSYSGTGGSAMAAPTAQSVPAEPSAVSSMSCYQFSTEASNNGTPITCPTPPSTATTSSASAATPSAAAMPAIIYPYQVSYSIEIGSSTELMLRDRTPATLNDFAAGDTINVFGYYNPDGSIQAYLVRDTSEPPTTQTIQLDNVNLVSISGTSLPATLAVTQDQGAPCYSFDSNGTEQSYACPMGISSFSQNPVTQNLAIPSAEPAYIWLRKYGVTVDSQTIILDRNRDQLSLSNLNIGDQLNVYGETTDNGQTVDADIIRDLSIPALPPAPTNYTGEVTQVNADGSFVVETNDGQTITVQSPITVGATVSVTGILSASSSMLTSVSEIDLDAGATGGGGGTTPPFPVPTPTGIINGLNF
jgi:Domain of unknown function (DUF5666)